MGTDQTQTSQFESFANDADKTQGGRLEDADFEQKKKEMVDRVEDIFKKYVSAANPALSERGYPELEKMKAAWISDIETIFNDRKKKYEEMSASPSLTISAERMNLLREILSGATAEAETKLRLIEGVIMRTKTGEYINSADAGAVERAIKGIENLTRENPDLEETGLKLTAGKAKADDLTSSDYSNVINLLQPYHIVQQQTDAKNTFEVTTAGVLIGLMSPEQRYRLIQILMEGPKRGQTVSVIDGFLQVGLLSRDQGEALMKEAIAKGIMTQQQFDSSFKLKLEEGFYDVEARKYRELLREEDTRKYSGVYAENIMNRVVGRPLIGGILALWGMILTTLNIAANWQNKSAILKNPYVYAGLAGALAGTEIATGTMSRKNPWFGAGVVARGIDKLGGTTNDEKSAFEIETQGKIADIILNAPAPLVAYLDHGGYGTMLALRREKLAKGEKPLVTVNELIQQEKAQGNNDQAARLAQLQSMSFVSEESVNIKLNMVAEGCANILKIEDNQSFAALVMEVRATQKPSGAGSLPENPASAMSSAVRPPAPADNLPIAASSDQKTTKAEQGPIIA